MSNNGLLSTFCSCCILNEWIHDFRDQSSVPGPQFAHTTASALLCTFFMCTSVRDVCPKGSFRRSIRTQYVRNKQHTRLRMSVQQGCSHRLRGSHMDDGKFTLLTTPPFKHAMLASAITRALLRAHQLYHNTRSLTVIWFGTLRIAGVWFERILTPLEGQQRSGCVAQCPLEWFTWCNYDHLAERLHASTTPLSPCTNPNTFNKWLIVGNYYV